MADRRLPAPLFPWVFAFLMGGAMTAVITTILSLANDTQLAHLPAGWFGDWLLAWLIATPAIVLVAPHARALAGRIAVSPALGPGTKAPVRRPASPVGAAVRSASAKQEKITMAPAPHTPPHRSRIRRQRNHRTSK